MSGPTRPFFQTSNFLSPDVCIQAPPVPQIFISLKEPVFKAKPCETGNKSLSNQCSSAGKVKMNSNFMGLE